MDSEPSVCGSVVSPSIGTNLTLGHYTNDKASELETVVLALVDLQLNTHLDLFLSSQISDPRNQLLHMVSSASKKKAAQKKAVIAAKREGKAAASLKASASASASDRTCTSVLCSHPLSRDIRVVGGDPLLRLIAVDWFTVSTNEIALHPRCLVKDPKNELYKKSLEIIDKVPALHMEIHKNGLGQMTGGGHPLHLQKQRLDLPKFHYI
ncbi:Mitochondrial import receptor subunit [Arachis hypogaea]|nr:Mitochondrial import receptor subunit [Arachis hypogaea]